MLDILYTYFLSFILLGLVFTCISYYLIWIIWVAVAIGNGADRPRIKYLFSHKWHLRIVTIWLISFSIFVLLPGGNY